MTLTLDYELAPEEEFDALSLKVKENGGKPKRLQQYPARLHAKKVAAELGASAGLIYLPGEPSRLLEDSDQPPTFRQRRYFFYLTGVDFADCFVTYDIEANHLILWIPYVEPRQVLWFGRTPNASQALQKYDVDEVRYSSELDKYIDSHLHESTTLYLLHASQAPRSDEMMKHDHIVQVRNPDKTHTPSLHSHVDVRSLKPAMDRARVVKTDAEIALIRRANDISSAAHRSVAQNLLNMKNEREIQATILAVCNRRGAPSQSYPIIAGAGVNASTLHYGENDQPLRGKQVVVIDAGCEINCYASDITRTLPLTGKFTTEGAAVYALVQHMQEECIAAVRPGIEWYKVHLLAVCLAQEGLMKLGILKGDAKAIAEAGTATAFFPHGLGHHVGLEVHDVTGASSSALFSSFRMEAGKREIVDAAKLAKLRARASDPAMDTLTVGAGQRLAPNMIVTVEPGIYFCREYIEGYFLSNPVHKKFIDTNVLEKYYGVGGVRIEDDILVTKDGYENLTTAPKGQELLDVINGKSQ